MRDETFTLDADRLRFAVPPFAVEFAGGRPRGPCWRIRDARGASVGRAVTRAGARAGVRALYATTAQTTKAACA